MKRSVICFLLAAGWLESTFAVRGAEKSKQAPSPSASPNDQSGWKPNPALIAELERKKIPWNYRESAVPSYTLPDPLVMADGTKITSAKQWEQKGRPATIELFRSFVFGRAPRKPHRIMFEVKETTPDALDGTATRKRVAITSFDQEGKSFTFEAAVLTPNKTTSPVPAFLLINNRLVASADPSRQQKDGFWPAEEIINRGYATAVFRTNDVDPDVKESEARAKGVRGVWPAGSGEEGKDSWATIAAWAWGASRVLDYLQTDGRIDGNKVAVVGHSRGGKTALWAGAEDERFAIAISNDSGCGGAALSRRRFGETVAAINDRFPHWFCNAFKGFNDREDSLPIDHHQLIALMAPRGVYVASADADFWADQRGEFLSLVHASPVFALYDQAVIPADAMPPLNTPRIWGTRGYHIHEGGHNLTPYDWNCYMDFADRLWKDRANRE